MPAFPTDTGAEPPRCPRCDLVHDAAEGPCPGCRAIRATNRIILVVILALGAAVIGGVLGTLMFGVDLF